MGRSSESEVDARLAAMTNIKRQIAEMTGTTIKIEGKLNRIGDYLNIIEKVTEITEKTATRLRWHRLDSTITKTYIFSSNNSISRDWTYYGLMKFGRTELDSIIHETETKIKKLKLVIENSLLQARNSATRGVFNKSFSSIHEAYIESINAFGNPELSRINRIARNEVQNLIDALNIRVTNLSYEDCKYIIDIKALINNEKPAIGVPIHFEIQSGEGKICYHPSSTDEEGFARAEIKPLSVTKMDVKVKLDLEHLLGFVRPTNNFRNELIIQADIKDYYDPTDYFKLMQPISEHKYAIVNISPIDLFDGEKSNLLLIPIWRENKNKFFPDKWVLKNFDTILQIVAPQLIDIVVSDVKCYIDGIFYKTTALKTNVKMGSKSNIPIKFLNFSKLVAQLEKMTNDSNYSKGSVSEIIVKYEISGCEIILPVKSVSRQIPGPN